MPSPLNYCKKHKKYDPNCSFCADFSHKTVWQRSTCTYLVFKHRKPKRVQYPTYIRVEAK